MTDEAPPAPTRTVEAVLSARVSATRSLLSVRSADEARRIVSDFAEAVRTAAGGATATIDLSLGQGPEQPTEVAVSAAQLDLIQTHLDEIAEDAALAIRLTTSLSRGAYAHLDSLTGLPDRPSVDRILKRLRPGEIVLLVDLDGIGDLNRTHGRGQGDMVIRDFGFLLRSQVRERDHVGRYGGDSFVAVLPENSNVDQFVERLRSVWERDHGWSITFTCGAAVVTGEDDDTVDAARTAVDRARAEAAGTVRWAVR